MPRVQFVNQFRLVDASASFPTPKRIGELRYWLKAIQGALKECPRNISESEQSRDRSLVPTDAWAVIETDTSVKWIKFVIENGIGEKAHIIIDRQYNNLGR